MKVILTILFLTPFTLFGQLIDELPKDENGNLYFTEIIQVDSVSRNQLYLRANQFFVKAFKSSKDVIQLADKDDGLIEGKGFSIIIEAGVELQMWYSLKIQSKDGRYKYEIHNLYFLYGTRSSPPSEVFDKSVYYKKNGQPRAAYENRKNEMLKIIDRLILEMKSTMAQKSKNNEW